MSKIIVAKGKNIVKRTFYALKALSPKLPERGSKVLIKPNLVEPMPKDSGAITRPEIVEGIIQFLGNDYKIIVGEGAGIYETEKCFEKAEYYKILSKYDVEIVDLNKGPFIEVELNGKVWKKAEISKLALESYVISAAVLKEHKFGVTLSLKNMMGVLKPIGCPTKSYIHKENEVGIWAERLCDLLLKVRPNLAVIDATTGMYGSHLYGRLKNFDLTIVSEDALAADIYAAKILGYENILYLGLALKRNIGKYPKEIKEISL